MKLNELISNDVIFSHNNVNVHGLYSAYSTQITESLVENSTIDFSYNGFDVILTQHARERSSLRASNLDMTKFYTNMIDKLMALEQKMNIPTELLVYSKSYNQGIIVSYDRSIEGVRRLYIMTVLPAGSRHANRGTLPILIEHEECYSKISKKLREYISGIVKSRGVKLTEKTKKFGYFPVILANGFKHKIIIAENKFWDLSIFAIEVE